MTVVCNGVYLSIYWVGGKSEFAFPQDEALEQDLDREVDDTRRPM